MKVLSLTTVVQNPRHCQLYFMLRPPPPVVNTCAPTNVGKEVQVQEALITDAAKIHAKYQGITPASYTILPLTIDVQDTELGYPSLHQGNGRWRLDAQGDVSTCQECAASQVLETAYPLRHFLLMLGQVLFLYIWYHLC